MREERKEGAYKGTLHFSQKANLNASITEKGLHNLSALLKSNPNLKKRNTPQILSGTQRNWNQPYRAGQQAHP